MFMKRRWWGFWEGKPAKTSAKRGRDPPTRGLRFVLFAGDTSTDVFVFDVIAKEDMDSSFICSGSGCFSWKLYLPAGDNNIDLEREAVLGGKLS
ncbi:hypothetical protein Trydic_g10856 [Trypoxylus dichotomus]